MEDNEKRKKNKPKIKSTEPKIKEPKPKKKDKKNKKKKEDVEPKSMRGEYPTDFTPVKGENPRKRAPAFEPESSERQTTSFQPTSSTYASPSISVVDKMDTGVDFNPELELLNTILHARLSELLKNRNTSSEREELIRLRNSIFYKPNLLLDPKLTSYHILHPIFMNPQAEKAFCDKLRRLFSDTEDLPELLKDLITRSAAENEYSEDFVLSLFRHLQSVKKYADNKEDNEWTKLINCFAPPMTFYVDYFCPKLLLLKFDNDFGLFCPPNIVSERRPDFGLVVPVGPVINEKQKKLIVCLGEAARYGFEDQEHKDLNKLHKSMRVCIDDQLDHVPIEHCRVFGILQGKAIRITQTVTYIASGGSMLEVFEMKPQVTEDSDIIYYQLHKVCKRLKLNKPSYVAKFSIILQEIEYQAKVFQEHYVDKIDINFKKPPRDPKIERATPTHVSPKINPDNNNVKKNNEGDSSTNQEQDNEPHQSLEDKLNLSLNGALTGVTVETLFPLVRGGKLTRKDQVHHVALVIKTNDGRELEFLSKLKHPNIVRIFCFYSEPYQGQVSYIMALERLWPIQETPRSLILLQMARDICSGLEYLHSQHIIHRDIKPENLMRTKEGSVKIIDFNIATQLTESNNYKCYSQGMGTEGFVAPEVMTVDPSKGYDYKVDIYSLGCVLKELYIKEASQASPVVTKIIKRCLQTDPARRPTAKQLVKYIETEIERYNRAALERKKVAQKIVVQTAQTLQGIDKENANPNLVV